MSHLIGMAGSFVLAFDPFDPRPDPSQEEAALKWKKVCKIRNAVEDDLLLQKMLVASGATLQTDLQKSPIMGHGGGIDACQVISNVGDPLL